jgi:hypothetical protein
VAEAGEHGEAGIFGEERVGDGEIAEEEDGVAVGFDAAGVEAIGAEAGGNIFIT